MSDTMNPQWARHFDAIGEELMRLSIACDVRLRDPGVIQRILKNDESVCGRNNAIGFKKLRRLLIATYDSLGKAVDRIGADETREIADAIAASVARRRDGAGNAGD